MSFAIFTDTSANIPTELAEKYNIGVVPLSYFVDGEQQECVDTRTFDSAAYYAGMKKGAKITTSQINPQKYVDYMEPTLKEGKDILFVGMAAAELCTHRTGAAAGQLPGAENRDRGQFGRISGRGHLGAVRLSVAAGRLDRK